MPSPSYVYAILPGETQLPPGLAGLGDAPLASVVHRDLAAVISPVDSRDIGPLPDRVLQHERIVEALRQVGPALPVRFGTVLPDREAVVGAIAKCYHTLTLDLDRIGDKVEFGVTVLWDAPAFASEPPAVEEHAPHQSEGAGVSYLRARMREYRRDELRREGAAAIRGELDTTLGIHAIEQRSTVLPTPGIAVRAAYLLHPSSESQLKAAFEKLRRDRPELRLLLSGPWPPYTFVTPPDQGQGPADETRRGVPGTGHAWPE